MMKTRHAMALALTAPIMAMAPATAETTAPAAVPSPAAGYSVEETALGAMLDDPAAKAVLAKHIPAIVGSDQIQMARGMTLKQLQQYAGDMLSDTKLADIQADLNKLPTKK